MKSKPLLALLALVALIVAGAAWWLAHRGDGDADTLTLHGNVDIRQVSLAFDGSGRIEALEVEEGNAVKAGQLLGRLDTRALALQAAQAQAQIEVQQQNLARLRNGTRPEEIDQARSRVRAAQADAARSAQDLARLQEIARTTDGRGVSAQALDQARSAVEVARAKGDEAAKALRLAEIGPRAEDIAGAGAQLKASQAQLALLQFQISQGELKAPADGVVRSRLLEPGDMASPQRPVFALALVNPKWIRAYLAESELGRVRTGMRARIVTDSQPDRPIDGQVGYISSVAEFTPKSVQTEELRTSLVYEVRVLAQDPGDVLRLGQPATVHIDLGGTGR